MMCIEVGLNNCRSRSSKVTDFYTNRKLICDFLLVNNTSLNRISHRFWLYAEWPIGQIIAIDRGVPLFNP